MGLEPLKITRRHRILAAAAVLCEAGEIELEEQRRLAGALWAGWHEVMRARLGAAIYSEWQEKKPRPSK